MNHSLFSLKKSFELRSKLNQAIREFFLARDYIEVETPIMILTPALELHIDAIQADKFFLRTSPELYMKRLLANGFERIFQVGKCFRNGEFGRMHNPEFTMLEWYKVNTDYFGILDETKELIVFLAQKILDATKIRKEDGTYIELQEEWHIFSISDVFKKYAGWDPLTLTDEAAQERFDEDLVNKIEPALPKDKPVVLYDYPFWQAALAKLKDDNLRAERWELYINGIELANAFSELCDYSEQKKRFEECAKKRGEAGRNVYKLDEHFLDALQKGLPPSAGVALGIDRLLMLFAACTSLDEVIPFRNE